MPAMTAFPFEGEQVVAQVADNLQGEVMDNLGPVWPVCPRHDYGLHPGVHDGRAIWWCRPGDRAVAPIGDLGDRRRRRI